MVKKELNKEDMVTKKAVDSLTFKLNSNKSVRPISNNLPVTSSISAQDQFNDVLFTDFPVKRKLSVCDSSCNKRFNMGRCSNGTSANESKNLSKFIPNWCVDNWDKPEWDKPEVLRSPKTSATFAEASILARSQGKV